MEDKETQVEAAARQKSKRLIVLGGAGGAFLSVKFAQDYSQDVLESVELTLAAAGGGLVVGALLAWLYVRTKNKEV